MKKLFSLLCAMALVFGANAAPQSHPHRALKKAAFATQDVVLTVDDVQAVYYNEDFNSYYDVYCDQWEFDFFNNSSLAGYIVVPAVDGTHIVGAYDLSDVNAEGKINSLAVVSGTLVISYNAGAYHFSLSAICTDGQTYTLELDYSASSMVVVDYELYYYYDSGWGSYFGVDSFDDCLIVLDDAPFELTGETIDVYCDGVSILTDATQGADGWFEISGENDSIYANICVNTSSLVGTYGNADIDYDYTFIYINNVSVPVMRDEDNAVDVTVVGDTTYVEALLLARDGNYYYFYMKYYIPTPTETIELDFTSSSIDDDYYSSYGYVEFYGKNTDYELTLLVQCLNAAGTYDMTDVANMNSTKYSYLADLQTMTLIPVVAADLTVTLNNGIYVLEGYLISTDAKEYHFIIDGSTTAVDELEADGSVQKLLRNGQLVIEKNGSRFNVLGVKL